MTAAVYLILYSVLVSWLAPPLLSRLTRCGLNPRLGVAAWLTAIAGVLVAWSAVVVAAVVQGVGGLSDAVIVVCLELLGVPEQVAAPGPVSVLLLIGAGVLLSTIVAVRTGRALTEARSRSREHARAARLVGRPTHRPDVFVLTADRPAAYCVVGRPHAIVVTSAAVHRLDESQLNAVLAHEDAHLSGRHHHLVMVLRSLAHALPWLPLFTRGADAVGELLEMCADDTAARRHGSRTLVSGLITLAGPAVGPAVGLAAASTAVGARALRLLDPVGRERLWLHRLLVSATIAATVTAPIVVNVLCHHH